MIRNMKVCYFAFIACAILVAHPLLAEEPHPQSPEAMKKMADELEAARKEREAGRAQKDEQTKDDAKHEKAGESKNVTPEEELAQLKAKCEVARQRYMAPEKKQAIDECIANKVKTPAQCEEFYKDFGEGGINQSGSFRQRRYHNIPECEAYYEAEKKLHMNIK